MAKQGNCLKCLIMLSPGGAHVFFMMHFTFCIAWLYLISWELLPGEVLELAAGGSNSSCMCARFLLPKWSFCQVDSAHALGLHSTSFVHTLKITFKITGTMCGLIHIVYLQVFLVKRKLFLSGWLHYCALMCRSYTDCHKVV